MGIILHTRKPKKTKKTPKQTKKTGKWSPADSSTILSYSVEMIITIALFYMTLIHIYSPSLFPDEMFLFKSFGIFIQPWPI